MTAAMFIQGDAVLVIGGTMIICKNMNEAESLLDEWKFSNLDKKEFIKKVKKRQEDYKRSKKK